MAFEREIGERFERCRERRGIGRVGRFRALSTEGLNRDVRARNGRASHVVTDALLDRAAVAVAIEADLDPSNSGRLQRRNDDAFEVLNLDMRLCLALRLTRREIGGCCLKIDHELCSSAGGRTSLPACRNRRRLFSEAAAPAPDRRWREG